MSYVYDVRGKVTSMTDAVFSQNSQTYGYDGLGRLTVMSGDWGSGSVNYDALNNLTRRRLGGRVITVGYDRSKNRVSQSVDTGGWAGNTGTRAFAYDARGNVTQAGGQSFTYDLSNQPTSLSGTTSASYVYDGFNRRVKSVEGSVTRYSIYTVDGSLVQIAEPSNGSYTDYVRAGGIEIARVDQNGTASYVHNDDLSSTRTHACRRSRMGCRSRLFSFAPVEPLSWSSLGCCSRLWARPCVSPMITAASLRPSFTNPSA